jgi:hypothetical protein
MWFPVELFQNRSRPDLTSVEVLFVDIPPSYMATWYTFLQKVPPSITILPYDAFEEGEQRPYCLIAPYEKLCSLHR